MQKLTKRQLNILNFIRKYKKANNQEIKKYLEKNFGSVSRVTIVRNINKLLENSLIQKYGKGRNIYYQEFSPGDLLAYFDTEEYFKQSTDKREIAFENFNFDIFKNLKEIFISEELAELEKLNNNYQERIKKLSSVILKKEFERLTIELSWKSSRLEGNTYSLIDTEILIKQNKEAKGKSKEEAIMILNHKKALDYVIDERNNFKKITLHKIENIHKLIVQNLDIQDGLRSIPVGIVGTRYKPLGNQHQIIEAVEKFVKVINKLRDPFSKALVSVLIVSYIQMFEDGNKRTARLLSNAILLANNICPLSYRSIDEADYKKATIIFYEQNSARFFKELFIEQFKFAVGNYFL
ncbi:MAG: Fic family protein [Patescibacteria group bacterium]|nr:Fic family protein [Patescibacteria group bacterium]